MKKPFAIAVSVFVSFTLWGQGAVHFGNSPTTLISTNDFQGHLGNILGAGNYGFGLYLGPLGSSGDSLNLTARASNGNIAGRFDGGTEPLPFPAGTQLSFQVRGWSSFGGATYEQAYNNASGGASDIFLGQSTIGFLTVPASGTIELFGTGPGQISGFELAVLVPEPSTCALIALGSALLLLFRRKSVA